MGMAAPFGGRFPCHQANVEPFHSNRAPDDSLQMLLMASSSLQNMFTMWHGELSQNKKRSSVTPGVSLQAENKKGEHHTGCARPAPRHLQGSGTGLMTVCECDVTTKVQRRVSPAKRAEAQLLASIHAPTQCIFTKGVFGSGGQLKGDGLASRAA